MVEETGTVCRPSGPDRRAVLAGALGALVTSAPPAQAARARFEIAGPDLSFNGAPARLVGVAAGDPLYIRKDRPASDYAVIAEVWRANTVRISLHPGHFRADRAKAMRALADDVTAARAAGLFVIVDWHVIGFPGRFTARPEPDWGLPVDAYDPDLALALAFWGEAAQTFGQDGGVIFELWNEPVVDPKLWISTGEHWPLLKETWLRLIEAIRRHSENLVLATGGRWAHDLKGAARTPIEDNRVAYSWHAYPPEDRGRPGRWLDSLDGIQRVRPVVVTEWGFCRACPDYIRGTAQDFGQPFTQLLEELNLHSTAWCWAAGAEPAMLERDWVSATEFGRFVRRYLETARRPRKVPS
ncbi:MAG TPA: cellulase family glycosylhydrolase [Xanthobacteraceae bacterium]|nr:cellulase family glycosylhydrolase [Xanthobacteraceae bacterium]